MCAFELMTDDMRVETKGAWQRKEILPYDLLCDQSNGVVIFKSFFFPHFPPPPFPDGLLFFVCQLFRLLACVLARLLVGCGRLAGWNRAAKSRKERS